MGALGSIRVPRLDQMRWQVRGQGASLLGARLYCVPCDGCPVWSLRFDGSSKGPKKDGSCGVTEVKTLKKDCSGEREVVRFMEEGEKF